MSEESFDSAVVAVLLAAFAQESGEPMPVHREQHASGCACPAVYECPSCGRWCGWCFGCHDEMPAVCDDCWCRFQAAA